MRGALQFPEQRLRVLRAQAVRLPGAGDGRGVVPRHRSRGLLRPVSDAAHMLLRPACVSSVVQLARVLTRCVLVAVVVAVVSAESKDCDPKKVCACSPTPRACPACVPRLCAI